MSFPVYLRLGDVAIHPHPVFEVLAFVVAFQVYRLLKRKRGDTLRDAHRIGVIVAAAFGAALGSRALYWLVDVEATWAHRHDVVWLIGGKTIVGAIVGGIVTVELYKRIVGIERRTGDLFGLPLVAGIAVGRIGCFLTGLADNTHGVATDLPWGVDFGDGVLRHPTQLYEIVFLLVLGGFLLWRQRHPFREGDLFRGVVSAYLGFRLVVDGIKPRSSVIASLTAIQWAALAGMVLYASAWPRLVRRRGGRSEPA